MHTVDPFAVACQIAQHLFSFAAFVAAGYCAYLLAYRRSQGLSWLVPIMVLLEFLDSAFNRHVYNLSLPYRERTDYLWGLFVTGLVWQVGEVTVFYLIARRIKKKETAA